MKNPDKKGDSKNGAPKFYFASGPYPIINTVNKGLVGTFLGYLDPFKKAKLAKKEKQYELLKPVGFEYAPKSAKGFRGSLEYANDVEQMEFLKSLVSYNPDGTINFLQLNKTFSHDFSGKDLGGENKTLPFIKAQELCKQVGYDLMTDYNDIDPDEIKHQSDWYRVINLFSRNNGDTRQGMALFMIMTGCSGFYWTGTACNEDGNGNFIRDGKTIQDGVYVRQLNSYAVSKYGSIGSMSRNICGRKNSMSLK